VTLTQAVASLPATVPVLRWTLGFHGAFHQSINLAPCEDGAEVDATAYVHAEYDGPVMSGTQGAGFVIVAVFATPAKASHALATITSQARHCPSSYAPPFSDGAVNTTVSRRPWGPGGWHGFLITGTSTDGTEIRRAAGLVDVYAARGNVLVETITGDDLRTASLALQSLWARQLATAMTNRLNHHLH
jgi:hypothetical protein